MLKLLTQVIIAILLTLLFIEPNAGEQALSAPLRLGDLMTVWTPIPNDRYMASERLTIIYDISSRIRDYDIQLSISLASATTSFQIDPSADITLSSQQMVEIKDFFNQDFKERKKIIYIMPAAITQGSYEVVFADSVSKTSISIPINVYTGINDFFNHAPTQAASVTSISKALPTGTTPSSTSSGSNEAQKEVDSTTPRAARLLPSSSNVIVPSLSLLSVALLSVMLF